MTRAEYEAKYGQAPVLNSVVPAPKVAAAPAAPQAPGLVDRLVSTAKETAGNIGGHINEGAQALNDSASGKINPIAAGVKIFGTVVGVGNDLVGGAVKGGLQTVDSATGGSLKKIQTGLLSPAIQKIMQTPAGAMGINALRQGEEKWSQFEAEHPSWAAALSAVPEVAQMAANFVGVGAASKGAQVSAPLIKEAAITAKNVATRGAGVVTADAPIVGAKATAARALDRTIDAITPELQGTKLTDAYKDVLRGNRTAQKGGILQQQAVSQSERELGMGQRLFDEGIRLTNKPVKDLEILRGALNKTEAGIENVLKGDPELVFLADKPTLFKTLNTIKTKTPREFGAIKDSKKVFDDVVEFGKDIVNKADDDVRGLRNARTAFDAQARREYPNAYKGGEIDTKTPAGRAIKSVRDAINDHLYDTAPEGSELKRLIGIEADIFRAGDAIAPRAAGTHGQSLPIQMLQKAKEHPLVTGVGAYAAAKTLAPGIVPGPWFGGGGNSN